MLVYNVTYIIVELMRMLSFAESIPFLYNTHMVALLYPICLFSYILHTYHCWTNVFHSICKEHYIYHTLWAHMFQHYPARAHSSNVLMQWMHPYRIRWHVHFPFLPIPCSNSHSFTCSPMITHGKMFLIVILIVSFNLFAYLQLIYIIITIHLHKYKVLYGFVSWVGKWANSA